MNTQQIVPKVVRTRTIFVADADNMQIVRAPVMMQKVAHAAGDTVRLQRAKLQNKKLSCIRWLSKTDTIEFVSKILNYDWLSGIGKGIFLMLHGSIQNVFAIR